MTPRAPRNTRRPGAERASVAAEASPTAAESSPPPPLVKAVPTRSGPAFVRIKRAARSLWSGTRILIGVVLVVSASLGAAWGARRYILKSQRFVIKTITVEGTGKLTPDAVAQAGGVTVGANVFALDLDEVKRKLEKEPYVAQAVVTRKLPNTIAIKIVERQPAALVILGADLYLATNTGEVFKKVEPGDETDLPVVTGIRPELATEDRQGLALLVRRALDIVDEADKTTVLKRFPIEEVHIEKDGSVEAIVGREGISIRLGDPPFKRKIEQADRVLTEIQNRRVSASVVFLDNDASPERVVVRLRQ